MNKYLIAATFAVAGFVAASSAALAGVGLGCNFYKDKSYVGASFYAKAGQELTQLRGVPAHGGFDNSISSVSCTGTCGVKMFNLEGWKGATRNAKNQATLGYFDNKASSLKVICPPK